MAGGRASPRPARHALCLGHTAFGTNPDGGKKIVGAPYSKLDTPFTIA